MKLNELERQAVLLILSGLSERIEPEHLTVEDRRISKAGWMLDFKQDQTSALTNPAGSVLNDLYALLNDEVSVGFLLFLEDSHLSALECYVYDKDYPDEVVRFSFMNRAELDLQLGKIKAF